MILMCIVIITTIMERDTAAAIMAVEAGRRPEKMSDTSLDALKASKILATIMMTMMDGSEENDLTELKRKVCEIV